MPCCPLDHIGSLMLCSQIAWSAELGSAGYVCYKLWPGKAALVLYLPTMIASNVYGLIGAYQLTQLSNPLVGPLLPFTAALHCCPLLLPFTAALTLPLISLYPSIAFSASLSLSLYHSAFSSCSAGHITVVCAPSCLCSCHFSHTAATASDPSSCAQVFSGTYVVLASLIVLLRFVGLAIELQNLCNVKVAANKTD